VYHNTYPPPRFSSESLGRLVGPSLGKNLDRIWDQGKCVAQNPTRRFARKASLFPRSNDVLSASKRGWSAPICMIRNPARHRDRSPRPPKKPVAPLPQPVAPQKNRSDRSIAGIGRGGLFCCSFPTGISRGRSDETGGSDRSFPKSIGPADFTDRSGRPPPPHRSKVAAFLRLPLRKKNDRTDRSCMVAGPAQDT